MTHYLCTLLGHRYRPRYDTVTRSISEAKRSESGWSSARIVDSDVSKTYRTDVCERCGAVTNSKEQQ